MHLLIITSNYPYRFRPHDGPFVQTFARALAFAGIKCTVIRPISMFYRRYGRFDPLLTYDHFVKENPITVWSPRYLSASSKNLKFFHTNSISQFTFARAALRTIKRIDHKPDVLYGHFLYPSGVLAVKQALDMKIPSVVAVGESTLYDHVALHGSTKCRRDFCEVRGIVAVSNKNKKECERGLGIPKKKIKVFPNGVDLDLFYPRDRNAMRKKFDFPMDKFIIAFIGSLNDRKGPHRLLDAVNGLADVKLIFLGAGNIPLRSSNVLFQGVLPHSRIPEILSAADIFALPTLSEGSCNGVLEALACGLPVVTSNGEFNDDLIDDRVSIRVNPLDSDEIRNAILKLYHDETLRKKMSACALSKIKDNEINLRATRILKWIREIRTDHSNEASETRMAASFLER